MSGVSCCSTETLGEKEIEGVRNLWVVFSIFPWVNIKEISVFSRKLISIYQESLKAEMSFAQSWMVLKVNTLKMPLIGRNKIFNNTSA